MKHTAPGTKWMARRSPMRRNDRHHNRGISILEVLISIFIVAVGLLGVLSMLPIGHMFAQNAIRSDQASALAEKGFNDVMLRGWLSNLALDEPVAVDPLGGTGNLGGSSLKRDNAGISVAMAREIFIGTDDVSYTEPDKLGDQPQVVYITMPDPTGGAVPVNRKRGYVGRYSYLVTVVPQGAGSKLAKVSVAVFFKRDLSNEVAVSATGIGGSDVELAATDLKIKKNQWILLEGANDYYQWFRVVVAGRETDVGASKTWVSLDGPAVPASFSGKAILFDQVLSVYERTVTIQ